MKELIQDAMSFESIKRFYEQFFTIGKMSASGEVSLNCRWHDDKTDSFSANMFTGLWKCFGECDIGGSYFDFYMKETGCNFKEALKYFSDFLGLDPSVPQPKKPKKAKGKLVCVYDYTDANGKIIHQTCRYEPKSFKQRQPDKTKEGAYLWNLKDIETVPYNLPEVVKAQTVYFVEGERDVETLKDIGLVGTCSPMGAGKFPDHLCKYFEGLDVIVLGDNDKAGKDHAVLVADRLSGIAKSVKVVELPDLKEHQDITDWINAGNTKKDLEKLSADVIKYESCVDYLNKKHSVIMVGGKCLIMNEIVDPVFHRKDINFSPVNDFHNFYAHRKIPNPLQDQKGQPKERSISKIWFEDARRRQYEGIVFDPSENTDKKYYNLYQGFAVQPVKGCWKLYKNHLLDNVASGNREHFNYIISWMARIAQRPGSKRPGTSIVLRGKQGTGKGVFVENFGKIFGSHYLHLAHGGQVTGRFNSHFKNVLLAYADEATYAGDKQSAGVLKNLVTETTIAIEGKGQDLITVRNHCNLILASNESWVVPTGLEERRFFVLDVSEKHMQDHAYFKAIADQMKNGGVEALLYDLMNIDISKVNLRKFPQTKALADQKMHSMTPIQSYWHSRLSAGTLLRSMDYSDSYVKSAEWENGVDSIEQYDDYLGFCGRINAKNRMNNTQFGIELKKICGDIEVRQYTINTASNKRGRNRYFGSLNECRKYFSTVTGMKIDWYPDLNWNNIYIEDEFIEADFNYEIPEDEMVREREIQN